MPTPDDSRLRELEESLGGSFGDRGLLVTALTHRSHLNEVADPTSEDNERLEFLGDALLDYIAADLLYGRLPDAREGELTTVRAALVCEAVLSRYARQLGLGEILRLGRGESASGGRERDGLLCDAFEAVVGALYLDRGLPAAQAFALRFLVPQLDAVMRGEGSRDAKSSFQELAQQKWRITPHYVTIGDSGPDHAKHFVGQGRVGHKVRGTGEGRSKSDAARQAAAAALERIQASGEGLARARGSVPADRAGRT